MTIASSCLTRIGGVISRDLIAYHFRCGLNARVAISRPVYLFEYRKLILHRGRIVTTYGTSTVPRQIKDIVCRGRTAAGSVVIIPSNIVAVVVLVVTSI
jgi:hypothetical protein